MLELIENERTANPQTPQYEAAPVEQQADLRLRVEYALLCRLRALRRQGQQEEARELAHILELRDQADDWAMRWCM